MRSDIMKRRALLRLAGFVTLLFVVWAGVTIAAVYSASLFDKEEVKEDFEELPLPEGRPLNSILDDYGEVPRIRKHLHWLNIPDDTECSNISRPKSDIPSIGFKGGGAIFLDITKDRFRGFFFEHKCTSKHQAVTEQTQALDLARQNMLFTGYNLEDLSTQAWYFKTGDYHGTEDLSCGGWCVTGKHVWDKVESFCNEIEMMVCAGCGTIVECRFLPIRLPATVVPRISEADAVEITRHALKKLGLRSEKILGSLIVRDGQREVDEPCSRLCWLVGALLEGSSKGEMPMSFTVDAITGDLVDPRIPSRLVIYGRWLRPVRHRGSTM